MEDRNILQTLKSGNANWIGHILRRNCLLKYVNEGKMERRINVMERGGRTRKQLLNDLEENRGCWKLKEEPSMESSLWKTLWTCRKTEYRMNSLINDRLC